MEIIRIAIVRCKVEVENVTGDLSVFDRGSPWGRAMFGALHEVKQARKLEAELGDMAG